MEMCDQLQVPAVLPLEKENLCPLRRRGEPKRRKRVKSLPLSESNPYFPVIQACNLVIILLLYFILGVTRHTEHLSRM
jgi:hypothetical protein